MNNQDLGKLILRITLGGLMLFHGIDKLMHGVGGISNILINSNYPGFLAFGVYIGEVVAPVMIIFGYRTRLAALVFAFNMLVAVLLAHPDDLLALDKHGAWAIELQALYFFGALAVFFMGAGKLSFSNSDKWD